MRNTETGQPGILESRHLTILSCLFKPCQFSPAVSAFACLEWMTWFGTVYLRVEPPQPKEKPHSLSAGSGPEKQVTETW